MFIITRTTDVYNSPNEKAQLANLSGGNLFYLISPKLRHGDNLYNGVQTLIYQHNDTVDTWQKISIASWKMSDSKNLGVEEVPGLIVLRKTEMPAVLVETGFINSDIDNSF